MRCTQIPYPLDEDTSPMFKKDGKQLWKAIEKNRTVLRKVKTSLLMN